MLNDRCGTHQDHPDNGPRCETCTRIKIEEQIAKRVIKDALAAGFKLSVFDSDEITLEKSSDADEIFKAMFTSDDDRLYFYKEGVDDGYFGWVWFIYGNSGWDVISDYTTNLEHVVGPVIEWSEGFDMGIALEHAA